MRIGFDLSVIRHGLTNGTAIYAYRLLNALIAAHDAPAVTVYFGARASSDAEAILDDLHRRGLRIHRAPAPWRLSPDGAWWLPLAPFVGNLLEAVDVFHVGEFYLPPPTTTRYVATVHDLTTELFPAAHIRLNRWLHTRRLRWIRRHADRVLAVSRSTADDLLRLAPELASRVDTTLEARGTRETVACVELKSPGRSVLARYGVPEGRIVLTVGTLEPRKNQARLIEAFSALPDRFQDAQLVLAGGRGWKAREILASVEGSPARSRIHVLGIVSEADLSDLYRSASVFAFPSLYEGFGLPILEAMAAGTPVMTSNRSSMPEIAGDAALLVDPASVQELCSGLARLLDDENLRRTLSARGRAREREFTWERTARLTLESYRRAHAEGVLHG